MVQTLIVHLWTAPGKEDAMKAALLESAQIYLRDPGTINWFVMQDPKDPTAFSIVERYENEEAIKTHIANPRFEKFRNDVAPLTEGAKEKQIITYTEL